MTLKTAAAASAGWHRHEYLAEALLSVPWSKVS